MNTTTCSDRGLVDVAAVLVGMQAAIAVVSALEALAAATFLGGAATGPVALSAGVAIGLATIAMGLGRRAHWARRATLVVEVAVLAVALLNIVALPLLTGGHAALVSILTHIALPIAVIALLRRPPVRAAFAGVAA